MNAKQEKMLQDLSDREAIRDVVWRYCHGVDRADREVLQTIYWPDAVEKHGEYEGPAAGFIDHAIEVVGQVESLQHLIGNSIIRLMGTRANVQSSFFVHQVMKPRAADHPDYTGRRGDERCSLMLGGRYLDRFESRNGEWRIHHRIVAFDWWRLLDGAPDWNKGLIGIPVPVGSIAPDDLSYQLFLGGMLTGKA